MELLRTKKLRLYPNSKQIEQIEVNLKCCRYVWNYMLEVQNKKYERRGEHMWYNDMQNLLPKMKKIPKWSYLEKADSKALKEACDRLDKAFQSFFKHKSGYPKFHSRRESKQSYTTTHGERLKCENSKVRLPLLGWIKVRGDYEIKGKIKQATVIRDGNKYFVSIVYKSEIDINPIAFSEESSVGLDYKSDGLYVDSFGDCNGMPHWYQDAQNKLAKEQRKLAKKVGSKQDEKKSNRYIKQNNRIKKVHEHIANLRRDYLHKESTRLTDLYSGIFVEDIDMKDISRRDSGLHLGKATMNNGYGMFRDFLKYKCEEKGKQFKRIDKFFPSSQICHVCGFASREVKDLTIRMWTCPVCGTIHDRDVNAAINIKHEGIKMINNDK